MLSGVPKGSILEPLIFILYINGFPYCLSATIPFMFTDDIKIIWRSQGLEDKKLMHDTSKLLVIGPVTGVFNLTQKVVPLNFGMTLALYTLII